MKQIKEKHSLVMRWTHWVNFPLLVIMSWSGFLIYWANDVYTVSFFGKTVLRFFPQWFYNLLHIPHRLSEGMAFHFLFMWFFTLNGCFYVLYTFVSGEWRHLVPKPQSFKEAWQVLLFDLRIRKVAPPQGKYNAAQRVAYTAIIFMGAGSVVTGLAIYKPVQFYWLTWLCGGYHLARIWHFVLTIGYVFFFLIHIIQVILAGWRNFSSVVTGFEVMQQKGRFVKRRKTQIAVNEEINRRNFLSFGLWGMGGIAGYCAWRWLYNGPDEAAGITAGARLPLRRALNKSELFFRRFLFNENHLVKTYPVEMAAKIVRHNEDIGSDGALDFNEWRLTVVKATGEQLHITLDQIKALPKQELVFDFKCVEGWDQIQHWAGAKFIDFVKHFGLNEETKLAYVGLMTPDQQYYVGLDMASAIHPQTILAYEMNGKPLHPQHGKPLRLIIPVKYGIKNIKRIGTISFSNKRPPDYWAERGYDYYSGL